MFVQASEKLIRSSAPADAAFGEACGRSGGGGSFGGQLTGQSDDIAAKKLPVGQARDGRQP